MLAMLRTQLDHTGPDYRPLYTAWSDDMGLTWTTPIPTDPLLYNISPTLAVLDNGVLAVSYGRPGFHVAFSTDKGHTWGDIIDFSHLSTTDPLTPITGQFDLVAVGPNRLVAVGSGADGFLKVWPITVDLASIPAPPTIALLGLGGLALLVRTRRKK